MVTLRMSLPTLVVNMLVVCLYSSHSFAFVPVTTGQARVQVIEPRGPCHQRTCQRRIASHVSVQTPSCVAHFDLVQGMAYITSMRFVSSSVVSVAMERAGGDTPMCVVSSAAGSCVM